MLMRSIRHITEPAYSWPCGSERSSLKSAARADPSEPVAGAVPPLSTSEESALAEAATNEASRAPARSNSRLRRVVRAMPGGREHSAVAGSRPIIGTEMSLLDFPDTKLSGRPGPGKTRHREGQSLPGEAIE